MARQQRRQHNLKTSSAPEHSNWWLSHGRKPLTGSPVNGTPDPDERVKAAVNGAMGGLDL